MAESNVTEMNAEQEQEARAVDEVREEIANKGSTKPVNPGLVAWLVEKERLFSSNVGGDLKNAPERHPDVMLLKRLLPQSSFGLHVKLAWLCWRARQVRYFHPSYGLRAHTGATVMKWVDAVLSANDRDSTHDEAFEARAAYYSARPSIEARREAAEAEEEALALTLMRLPTKGRLPTVDYVPTTPVTGQSKAQEQANANLAAGFGKSAAEVEAKGVKIRKPVKA